MTEQTENLVIELLRRLHGEMAGMRTETRERLDRVELRLGVIEQSLASLLGMSASDRDEVRALRLRIERIERRLELRDAD
jgi:hypothetical protein